VKWLSDFVYPACDIGNGIINLVLSAKASAFTAQIDGLLPIHGFDCGGHDMALGGQHGPLQVERDYGVGGGDVQRLERLAGTLRDQGPVAVEIILQCFAVHRVEKFPVGR
jgi:hypothetical protein